jgi:hypothetical protein
MEMMPPGDYRLVARDKVLVDRLQSTSTLYYPGVRDHEQAIVVSIKTGTYLDGLDIRLPGEEKRYRIVGRMEFADGAPAAFASVRFTASSGGYTELAEVRRDGTFGLSIVAGVAGQLTGQMQILERLFVKCPELKVGVARRGLFRILDAEPVPLSGDADRPDVLLRLPSPSCKAWPPPQR